VGVGMILYYKVVVCPVLVGWLVGWWILFVVGWLVGWLVSWWFIWFFCFVGWLLVVGWLDYGDNQCLLLLYLLKLCLLC